MEVSQLRALALTVSPADLPPHAPHRHSTRSTRPFPYSFSRQKHKAIATRPHRTAPPNRSNFSWSSASAWEQRSLCNIQCRSVCSRRTQVQRVLCAWGSIPTQFPCNRAAAGCRLAALRNTNRTRCRPCGGSAPRRPFCVYAGGAILIRVRSRRTYEEARIWRRLAPLHMYTGAVSGRRAFTGQVRCALWGCTSRHACYIN